MHHKESELLRSAQNAPDRGRNGTAKVTNYMKILYFLMVALPGMNAFASDFQSARTTGLAGAGHAAPLLNDSIYLNPSFAAYLPTYSGAFNFARITESNHADGSEGAKSRLINASIQDGRSELFAAGVGYTVREDGSLLHIGAAKTALKQLGFGLGGKFFFTSPGVLAGGGKVIRDMTFSTTGVLSDSIQTALVIDNLLETDNGKSVGMYREFTLGTKFNIQQILLVYADPHYTPGLPGNSEWGYELGLEFVFMTDFFFRLGNFKNSSLPSQPNLRSQGYTWGLGWIGPRMSFDFAMARALGPKLFTDLTAGVTLYF